MNDTPTVQSLARGLAVLHSFNGERPRQTLAQVAEVTGLARATARRFLHTLVTEGYARTDGSEFWLTPGFWNWAIPTYRVWVFPILPSPI